ncbi:Asp-tRNA(Asn)/Glu-tRNA(Gln) amidotransferase subunit GatA [Polynucleobacter sp. Latsch14-2]|jgi:aspartyl-tRNA(Asn)/glutamyl-tRNA(Gln) amidotransferase subunit A|uniref:Asp-tRNA(Asn)/Glu-tRNA(Gln) amidotransferase subunit GatA n=1 Tax=Polynucleobacter sp. Latsch14-2 TaxID=2576920 RepID=UPI001C0C122D|nr:Asp-tRNA(Asn)/Glu-tRNA(Gln) amidotransferase subunit GatA [Polynucleobacter sp. Latsch14-2]MBU3613356.1 Asp-tRNA(Asn)/Glu-tRNA(Gln) amidotransferase subunit GatA [Polynucleobacter sp. Latsch14-2]
MSWHTTPIALMAKALAAKEVSSTELTKYFLERIESGKQWNAYLDVNTHLSLEQASAADSLIAAGKSGKLTGIPVAHKDVFVTRGWRSTAASKILDGYLSPFDATVVANLGIPSAENPNGAGMVCLGKTNMDEFAMGSSNENSAYGPVLNPWNSAYVAGGSSGGSAAAVAAGLAPIATGTDTGGSIRQPAAFCGLTGIKPSYGRVSRYGMIAYASSLDQAGPMGKTAEDCALLLSAMSSHDPRDSTSLADSGEDYGRYLQAPWKEGNANPAKPLEGLRIGLPKEFFAEGLAEDVAHSVNNAAKALQAMGAELIEVSLPKTKLSIPVYYVLAPAEASSNLSRFDGVRYGHRAQEYHDLSEMYAKSRTEGFGAEVKRRILIGTYVLCHGYYDAYYLQAQKIRRIIAADFQAAFSRCDIILGPVAPDVAWRLGEKSKDPVQMYLEDIYTLSTNLAGLPAMSVPCGFSSNNLPIGMQFIGNYFSEARLLQVAHQYQQASDWHLRQAGEVA